MLHACGITAFLTPLSAGHTLRSSSFIDSKPNKAIPIAACAVTGDLKESPDDFVVVEVDPTGHRTDADDYQFPDVDAPSSAPRTADVDNGDANEDIDVTGVAAEESENEGVLSKPEDRGTSTAVEPRTFPDLYRLVSDAAPQLNRLFGSAAAIGSKAATLLTQQGLSVLVSDVHLSAQGKLPSCTTPQESTAFWWRGSYILGEFRNKQERQLVHLLVRRCYPHLRTYAVGETTLQSAKESASSSPSFSSTSAADEAACIIACSLDLHYVLFRAALGPEAAVCIAHWAIAAQAARQERHLADDVRLALQSVTPLEEGAVPASVRSEVCCTSFDTLTETMRRGVNQEMCAEGSGCPSAVPGAEVCAASGAPLLSDKDVRRHVHDVLRRFYPFIKCQVREGQVTLRYTPRPAQKVVSSGCGGAAPIGVRRPREEEQADACEGHAAPHQGGSNSSTSNDARGDGERPGHVAGDDFLHFVVTKRNLDTAELRQLVAKLCGVKDGAVCVAGMKDKKAVTTQRCSVPNTAALSFRNANSSAVSAVSRDGCAAIAAATPASPVVLRWSADPVNSYAQILCSAPRSRPVHLGQLAGNCFSVRIRHLRWASAEEQNSWHGNSSAGLDNAGATAENLDAPLNLHDDLRVFLERRFACCVERGFVNYFGQQRFGETIARADDHTGVHLFAGRWVDAVRSLYRGCPDVYDAFPEKMEARFVPGNSRDAQVMTHALRQTYRMYFSEHPLTRADVQSGSAVWTRLCEKAITEGVAYYLRSLWVHAGQSAFFNLAASFIVQAMDKDQKGLKNSGEGDVSLCNVDSLFEASPAPPTPPPPRLSYAVVSSARLPLGGYQVSKGEENEEGQHDDVWRAWKTLAIKHALQQLRWTPAQAFEQRKVAGVPVPGSWRAVVVRPRDASLHWEENEEDVVDKRPQLSVQLSFALPSSSYATVFLREVLGCDKWW